MQKLTSTENYKKLIEERKRTSKVYSSHQLTGLALAEILDDKNHKSLYMKLAKVYDGSELFRIAKSVAEKKDVRKKGAYFMRIVERLSILSKIKKPKPEKPKKKRKS